MLDGSLPLEEVREALNCEELPRGEGYHTLAGLVLNQLGEIPSGGEQFALEGYRFEVVGMDGHRIPAGARSAGRVHGSHGSHGKGLVFQPG